MTTHTTAPSAKVEPSKFPAALVAPAGSRKLRMGELTLDAVPRYVFDRALVLGEGTAQQAVAWLKADADAHDVVPGLLMAYGPNGQAKQVMTLPSFVPIAPGCVHATRLVQTGTASVLLDTVATCPAGMVARVPVEAVSVIAPASVISIATPSSTLLAIRQFKKRGRPVVSGDANSLSISLTGLTTPDHCDPFAVWFWVRSMNRYGGGKIAGTGQLGHDSSLVFERTDPLRCGAREHRRLPGAIRRLGNPADGPEKQPQRRHAGPGVTTRPDQFPPGHPHGAKQR